ncbi:MAG: LarC family nickel insertion protein [Candidatus Competibacteraceae bacterium]|nr:LarC family nickel insertion protein [Candidatus Competibacteraceae bacterium]
MHVHLDPVGGIAGDMFIAATLDAWPEWQDDLFAALASLDLPPGWLPQLQPARQHGIQGRHFQLLAPADKQRFPSGRYARIRERIEQSPLSTAVKQHALGIFKVLAQAEAKIHGIPIDDVHFHELADWDSIADIVAAAWLIDRIGADSWSIAPLPLGSGLVNTEHGPLPVPAPATALLLQGLATCDDGLPGERVTPTGAAILCYLGPQARTVQTGSLARQGFGLGSRTLPDRANTLRLLAWDNPPDSAPDNAKDNPQDNSDQVAVIGFEIDDQTGEDLALALDRLRALDGVLDVIQMPAFGKKGRLVSHVQILAEPQALHPVCQQCLLETTTIGLRWRLEQRLTLPRTLQDHAGLPVKTVQRPDGSLSAKADITPLAQEAGHQTRQQRRRQAEDNALNAEDSVFHERD